MLITIENALEYLKQGNIVALPTETVYGLAGSIYSHNALEKIFLTKERPLFDPLIVHVSSLVMAKSLSDSWNGLEIFLAEKFWPGPLTIIKRKNHNVSDLITASLPSVALRMPQHPIMLKIIQELNTPLAAPSANKFKSTSPTTALHVEDEFQSNVPVVDGGECSVGIESTILEVLDLSNIKIYRPGIITKEDLKNTLSQTSWKNVSLEYSVSEVAPGQLKEHYRPKKPITLRLTEDNTTSMEIRDGIIQHLPLNLSLAARCLYSYIREADKNSTTKELTLYFSNKLWNDSNWFPIRERLEKACSKIIY